MMKFGNVALACGLVGVSAIGGGLAHRWQRAGFVSAGTESRKTARADIDRSVREAQSVVAENYVAEITPDKLTKASIQGMLRVLDPHSNYFDSKEFQEMKSEQHSRFYGIGVSIVRRNDRIYVLSTIEDTPANRAGLRPGDSIIKVDGESTVDWSTGQVLEKVRGEQGETVEITVERLGVPKPLTFKIVRDSVPLPSIRTAFMIKPGVGYIALSGGFNHTTEDELRSALGTLKENGMRSLVLDLRGNPGGLLTQAVEVSNIFLRRDQKIVSVKGREGQGGDESRDYKAKNTAPFDKPVVVLIDKGTASASEIVAGALQDHDRAVLVGEQSFGKGLVQRVFELPFGSGLTLTTAKYYTPSGRCIQRSYTGQSLYEYYAHHSEGGQPAGAVFSTDTGQKVYGGGGITPEVAVKRGVQTPIQVRLSDATFEFARQLSAGVVPGLVSYRVERTEFRHQLKDTDLVVNDRILAAFRDFLRANDRFRQLDNTVTPNLDFIQNQIRQHLATAAYGTDAGFIVQLQADEQVTKALAEDTQLMAGEVLQRAQGMQRIATSQR